MRELLETIATDVRARVLRGELDGRRPSTTLAPSGDPQFAADDAAETAVWEIASRHGAAVFCEGFGYRAPSESPEWLLVVDAIDGTRPFAAGLEMATISIAAARMAPGACLGDVEHALVTELRSGASLYACADGEGVDATGYRHLVPRLSPHDDMASMFWSFELNGHPARLITASLGRLVDGSAASGGAFVFNSATFSISRIVTGQLDAYVDIGNRLLRDHPELEPSFRAAGQGRVLHLFSYDLAAIHLIARKAGVVITDAYGSDLDGMYLLDATPSNLRSCVAASTPSLHDSLLGAIKW
jgi:myo-inositol-1(or 4)-monophosphatase